MKATTGQIQELYAAKVAMDKARETLVAAEGRFNDAKKAVIDAEVDGRDPTTISKRFSTAATDTTMLVLQGRDRVTKTPVYSALQQAFIENKRQEMAKIQVAIDFVDPAGGYNESTSRSWAVELKVIS